MKFPFMLREIQRTVCRKERCSALMPTIYLAQIASMQEASIALHRTGLFYRKELDRWGCQERIHQIWLFMTKSSNVDRSRITPS